jgi:hypothetical protein
MKRIGSAILGLAFWAVVHAQAADVTFTDITQSAGLSGISNCSWSFAWADFDGDNDLDMATSGHVQQDSASQTYLLANDGNLVFTDVTSAAGVNPLSGDPHGVGFGDFDNDSDADLLIVHGTTKQTPGINDNEFYRNEGNGTFVDINDSAGTTYMNYRNRGVTWLDLDQDGLLDIFSTGKVNLDGGEGNLVLHNNGDETFSNTSLISGLQMPGQENFTSTWADYDHDNDLDVFVCKQRWFFANNGDGTFTDVTTLAGITASPNLCRGASFGDYDHDGNVDLFVPTQGPVAHTLYHNNGDGTFTDVAALAGVTGKFPASTSSWGDVDNDGDLDLYVTSRSHATNPNRLYRNNGDGTFTDIASNAGVGGQTIQEATDAALLDLDQDGFLDIFVANGDSPIVNNCQGPYLLLKNGGNDYHWIQINLIGTQGNRQGIGAKVTVETADGLRQVQHYVGGQHYISQDWVPVHFGIGANSVVDHVEVLWPSGQTDHLMNLSVDRKINLTEGSSLIPLSVTTTSLPDGQVGMTYNVLLEANGGAVPYAWSVSGGVLPAGVFLDAGAIIGVPTTTESQSFTVRVEDANGSSATALLSLTVAPPPLAITTLLLPDGEVGVAYDAPLSATGGVAPYTWTVNTGILPEGLVLNASGSITGIPTMTGMATLTMMVIDTLGSFSTSDLTLTINLPAPVEVTYTDLSAAGGFGGVTSCSLSAAWSDYDNDGDMDVITIGHIQSASGSLNQLYRNNGNLTFSDVIASSGVLKAFSEDPHGAGWGDFDRDGDADLFIAHGVWLDQSAQNHEFYRNDGGGVFSDIAVSAGVTIPNNRSMTGVSWVDYNNDGSSDLFVSGLTAYKLFGNLLYQNDGSGIFTDQAVAAGVAQQSMETYSAAWQDYDSDGRMDIFLCTDGVLFKNNGDGSFSDVTAAAGVTPLGDCSAAAWGDYDNDQDADLFVSSGAAVANALYRNNGDGSFTDVGPTAGVADTIATEGAMWGDYDNDADLDLLVVSLQNKTDVDRLYKNNGDGTFTDVGGVAGVAVQVAGNGADGMMVDTDNDGFLDMFITNGRGGTGTCQAGPYQFFHNNGENGYHWFKVKLIGSSSNADGIGAKVWLTTAGGTQYHEHSGPQHSLSQDQASLHFGLGVHATTDHVEVHWPSGQVDHLVNLDADQEVVLTEGVSSVPLSILTSTLPNGKVGTSYNVVVEAIGGVVPYLFQPVGGSLPYGLSLSPDGILSGIPTTGGNTALTLRVSDALGSSMSVVLTIQTDAPPIAAIDAVPTSGPVSLTVDFDGGASSDPDGSIVGYAWDFGDGTTGDGVTVSHVYLLSGSYVARLTVTDNVGDSDIAEVTVTADVDTVAIKSAIWDSVGLTLSVRATSTAAPDAILTMVGFGDLQYKATVGNYSKTVSGVLLNPGMVTITSDHGGVSMVSVVTE